MILTTKFIAVVIAALIALTAGWYFHQPASVPMTDFAAVDPSDMLETSTIARAGILTAAETEGLIFMREEEKLARDVYLALYEQWNLRPFSNIAASEATHMQAVKSLLDAYDITDPVVNVIPGAFTNPELATLYKDLTERGLISELEALRVGATIEDLDIRDLQTFIAATQNSEIIRVYENLMKGSRNHLRTFVGQIEQSGNSYRAQYLTQEQVDSIVRSPRERGPAR